MTDPEAPKPTIDEFRALARDHTVVPVWREVLADLEEGRTVRVSGVPFFVLDRRFGVSGAQPTELFAEALETAGLLLLTHAPDAEQRAKELLRSAEDHAGRQELWPLQGRVRRLLDELEGKEEIARLSH